MLSILVCFLLDHYSEMMEKSNHKKWNNYKKKQLTFIFSKMQKPAKTSRPSNLYVIVIEWILFFRFISFLQSYLQPRIFIVLIIFIKMNHFLFQHLLAAHKVNTTINPDFNVIPW